MHDQFTGGRRSRILNGVHDVNCECLAAIADIISGRRVALGMVVSDDGIEFTSTAILAPARNRLILHRATKPTQKWLSGVVGQPMCDKLLNESLFFTLDHARQKLAAPKATTTPSGLVRQSSTIHLRHKPRT